MDSFDVFNVVFLIFGVVVTILQLSFIGIKFKNSLKKNNLPIIVVLLIIFKIIIYFLIIKYFAVYGIFIDVASLFVLAFSLNIPKIEEKSSESKIPCQICNHLNTLESNYCENCGNVMDKQNDKEVVIAPKGKKICPNCGSTSNKEDKICEFCGTKIN